jgi:uncharacterized protein (DUF1697 family)
MTHYVALLRAINVGGHNPVAMSALRALAAQAGLDDPRTLLQSGNLVFGSDARSATELERLLEREASAHLGVETAFMVRSARDWQSVITRNPFSAEANADPGHLVVMFFKEAPKATDAKALQAAIVGRERAWADGREAYLVYPDGAGRSRLTTAVIEKTLGTRGTGRNWNTVRKLARMLGD